MIQRREGDTIVFEMPGWRRVGYGVVGVGFMLAAVLCLAALAGYEPVRDLPPIAAVIGGLIAGASGYYCLLRTKGLTLTLDTVLGAYQLTQGSKQYTGPLSQLGPLRVDVFRVGSTTSYLVALDRPAPGPTTLTLLQANTESEADQLAADLSTATGIPRDTDKLTISR